MLPEVRSRDPIEMTCPNCKENITTEIEKRRSSDQLCYIFLMALLCLCWIPCIHKDDWKDIVHACPKCKYSVGINSEM